MISSIESGSPEETQQLRARIAELEQERDVLKQIVEKSPLMVSILRAPDFVHEFVNPAFQKLMPGKQLVGLRYADVWAEVAGQPVATLQNVIATGRTFRREDAPWRIQQGADRPPDTVSITYSLIPLTTPGGEVDRILMLAEETAGAVRRRRARMEQELPGIEGYFWRLFDSDIMGIAVSNETLILAANDEFLRIAGCTRDDLLEGEECHCLSDEAREALQKTGKCAPFERELQREDGSTVPVLTGAALLKRDPLTWFCFQLDLTEYKRMEEAVRRGRAQLQAALDSTTDAVFISDAEGRFLNFNDGFVTFHRFGSRDECSRSLADYPDFLEVLFPDGTPAPVDMWAVPRALRGEKVANAEYTLRRKDTGETWSGSYSFSPIRDKEGQITGSVVVARDITEHKKTVDELFEAYERLQALMQALPVGVCFSEDTTCQRVTGNPAFAAQFEADPGDNLTALGLRFFQGGRELENAELPLQRAIREDRVVPGVQLEVELPSGLRRLVETSSAPIHDRHGKVISAVAVGADITARKHAEEELRETHTDLDHAQQVGQIGSWRLDVRGEVLAWSDETYRICGVPKGTPLSYQAFMEIVHPDDREYVATRWKAALAGEPYDIEHRIVVGGQVKWLREKAYLERDASGGLIGGFGIAQDITERKRAEEELREIREDLDRAQEIGQIGSWRLDGRRNVLIWSAETYRIFGVPEGTRVTPQMFPEFIHPDDREHVDSRWKAMVPGEPYEIEFRIVVDGQVKWIRGKWYLELDSLRLRHHSRHHRAEADRGAAFRRHISGCRP